VDLVESFQIAGVERNDLEVLGNPGSGNGLGERSDTTGD